MYVAHDALHAESVHPRACGDNVCGGGLRGARFGSPPRVRGQCQAARSLCYGERFTPARAGTIRRRQRVRCAASVHPRACGDNGVPGVTEMFVTGSPPRVRGQYQHSVRGKDDGRFTPARAGTMTSGNVVTVTKAVHPRACGDNHKRRAVERITSGSPPRVRGQLALILLGVGLIRFTPARAGTIPTCRAATSRTAVHPRACGDNAGETIPNVPIDGSPPRVRGQCHIRVPGLRRPRFTPARAGTMRPPG